MPPPGWPSELPPPALVYIYAPSQIDRDRLGTLDRIPLPPPWFVPVEAPACGTVLEVPAHLTNDGIARRFVCDLPAGHDDCPPEVTATDPTYHREVIDNENGEVFTWPEG